jgi:predicted patatin/cPLA2 family phospholipase
MVNGSEPYADALVFEPIPYRSALKENCSHVVVLRTRSDNLRTTSKVGIIEKIMTKRFFGKKQNLPNMVDWMHNQV